MKRKLYEEVCRLADYHCQFPSCTRTNIELHHKKKKSQGGKDTVDNLLVLCNTHHVMVHNTPTRFWELYNGR